jgi:hypothetical protein
MGKVAAFVLLLLLCRPSPVLAGPDISTVPFSILADPMVQLEILVQREMQFLEHLRRLRDERGPKIAPDPPPKRRGKLTMLPLTDKQMRSAMSLAAQADREAAFGAG